MTKEKNNSSTRDILVDEIFNTVDSIEDNFRLLLAQVAAVQEVGSLKKKEAAAIKEFFEELKQAVDAKTADEIPEDFKPGEEETEKVAEIASSSPSSENSGFFSNLEWYHWVGGLVLIGAVAYAGYRYFGEEEDDTIVVDLD